MKKIIGIFATVLFASSIVQAQPPQKMSYQAVVRDANNTLLATTQVGMQISILQGSSTGPAVYVETQTPTTNLNGLASLEIGSGIVVSGVFANINWANGPYFIKTETDPTGGTTYTITGTNELLSVPYALYALNGIADAWSQNGNSGTIDGINFIGTTDNVPFNIRVNNQKAGRIDSTLKNTFWGYLAGDSNTTGNSNTANGFYALNDNTTGSFNTSNGMNSLRNNTTGSGNTANGVQALYTNSTGSFNTANGVNALQNNYTGDWNTAIGEGALYLNYDGLANTANGNGALYLNTGGSYNAANGFQALYNNVGSYNSANGSYALLYNTGGSYNTACGDSSLVSNINGNNNTAIGYRADVLLDGLTNATAIGYNASVGASNSLVLGNAANVGIGTSTPVAKLDIVGTIKITDGTQGVGKVLTSDANGLASWATGGGGGTGWSLLGNAGTIDSINFIGTTDTIPFNIRVNNKKAGRIDPTLNNAYWGYQAANKNTVGYNNTAIGSYSLNFNDSGIDNVAIGVSALFFNNSGHENTACGVSALRFNSTGFLNTASGYAALYSNTTGYENTADGYASLWNNTSGIQNTATGRYALFGNASGSYNTANGVDALYRDTTGSYNTALGYFAGFFITGGSNNTAIGNNAQVAIATNSNQIRIGDTSITFASTQVAWTYTSDSRWKSDIQNSKLGLDFIGKLRPVSYYRNNDKSKKLEYGFIAQELEEALNNAGASNNGIISKDDNGMYGVRYNDLLAPMVKAIQELKEKNEEQEKLIEAMQKEIDALKYKDEK